MLSVDNITGQDTVDGLDVEMYIFNNSTGAQEGADVWEDILDKESILFVIHDVLDVQSVSCSLP